MTPVSRILVIYAHSAPHRSRVNRKLAAAARDLPNVFLHDLYETYPDFHIDVAREQALLAQSDLVVFLHPMQWYSMPSLLKEWVDVVLEPGWAHGPGGDALRDKGYWLAITTGSPADAYSPSGVHGRSFSDYLAQFEQTAVLCGMTWLTPHVLHEAHQVDDDAVRDHVAQFRQRLESYAGPADDTRHLPLTPTTITLAASDNGT
ncbi:MAG: NAD(P)H-dependent oxidoreductase [Herminiimonas sp.]|nr:NAD(P)H-dependent oxidoreductase [Herminiimonas sp.]